MSQHVKETKQKAGHQDELSRRDRIRANLAEIDLVMQSIQGSRSSLSVADSLTTSEVDLQIVVRALSRPLKRHKK